MRKLLSASLLLISGIAFSQVNSQVIYALNSSGDNEFKEGRYMPAIRYYKQVLDLQESNVKAQYQLAECYRLVQDYESAEYYYEKLGETQDIRFPLAGFWHAKMQKLKGRYDQSLRNFKEFSKFLVANELHEQDKYRYYYKQAKVEIDGCQLALNQITMVHPDYQFSPLAAPLNSEFNDYAAFTVWDDDIVCLTSARSSGKGGQLDQQFGENYSDIFRFSRSESGTWSELSGADKFEKVINTKLGEGSGAFNRERTKFYYTNCDEVCHIYVSKLSGGRWSDPVPLNHNINEIGFNSRHPSLTAGGDTLFYASDREGSIGELDLWMSLNAGNDNWGPPIHLGDQVNTPFNEISPFYDQKNQALFFASDGHRGFGGFDIYIALGTKFSSAEIYNAGLPFNSFKDDIFFFLGNQKGYLSSNQEADNSLGKFDIFEFTIRSKGDIISDVSIEGAIAGLNSLFTDDYNFDSSEAEIINQIISRMLSSSISEVDLVLTDQQLEVYNSLSLDDRERIDRIVSARIRKMTENMIKSMRTEDDFYYEQLSADKRRKVDNIVMAYLEQQGLGNSVSLTKDVFQFYNDIDTEEREKIDVLVSDRLKNAETFSPAAPTYNSFSEKDQKSLDGIALKYLKQKRNLGSFSGGLSLNEKVFMRDQAGNEEDINTAIRERLIGLSNEEKYRLVKADKDFYETLTQEEKDNLKAIATTFMVSDLSSFDQTIDNSQLAVFKNKNAAEQNRLDKLLLQQISNLANSSTYWAETKFTQDELQSALSENAEETIRNLLQIRPDLSEDQITSLQQFVKTTYDSYIAEPDHVFFDTPPSVVAVASGPSTGDASARLSNADLSAYENLSDQKKRAIDNIIGLDYLAETRYNRAKRLRDDAELKRLSKAEKVHIAILSKKITGQIIKDHEKSFLSAAFTHYNNLSEGRKSFYNRVVLDKAFETKNDKYILSESDVRAKRQLTSSDMALMERIKKFRYNNERVLTENLAVEAKDVDEAPVDIIAIAAEVEAENKAEQLITTQDILATEEAGEVRISLPINRIEGYSEITITGQLVGETTENPLSNYSIKLVAFDNEATVVEGYTDNDGFFDFTVTPRKYDITFQKAAASESVALSAFNVEGKRRKDTETQVSNTRAFFDVGSFDLRPEVKILLDEVIAGFKNSGKKIEIESHTDATGSAELNLKLSKDRGYAARDYLVANGISPSEISVIWHGQGKPIADNDNPFGRQINRRIDVRLVGKRKKSFGNFYIVRPGATVSSLAQSFEVDAQEIQSLNGLTGDVEAYQPIRLKVGNAEPDFNLVVPADIVSGSDFIYTVKPGDDLQKVSQKFNVPEELLIEQNNLSSTQLTPGTKLIIYPKN